MRIDETHELDVTDMKYLRSMFRVNRVDKWKKEMRRRNGVGEKLCDKMDRKALKSFGHVERMSG